MFGSGAKKAHVDQAPWSIQILTMEHLIEGSFHADKYIYGGEDIFAQAATEGDDEINLDAFEGVRFMEARIQPTGNLITPVQTFPGLELPTFDLVVAIIPADDASLNSAQKAFKAYRYPLDAVIYAGPYLLKGKLLSDYAGAGHSTFTNTYLIPLADVVIDCQVQGARLTGFRAPWLLLNGSLVHAFWIEGITPDS
jgi:hypothetical protein